MISIASNVMTFEFVGERQTLYRCMGCGEWFEAAVPWDNYCDECYEMQREATVTDLAAREMA